MPKPFYSRPIATLKASETTLALVLAIVALGTACAHYQPRPVSLDQTAASFDQRSLTNAQLQTFISSRLTNQPVSIANWNLDSLTLAAFYYHPSLQLARAQSQTAAAGQRTAAAHPNPTLSMTPGYDFSAVAPANPWIPGATLDLPIETAGKRGKRMLQARHLAAAAQLSVAATAWQIRSNVHVATIELWATRERERLLSGEIAHHSALVKLLQQRLAAGAIAANEIFPIQLAQVRLQSELTAARTAFVQAKARLAEAIGIPAAALPDLHLNDPILRADSDILPNAAALRESALRQRVDLLAALERYEAAQAALRLEIAKQYPDVRLGPGYQWDQGDHKWTVSISLDLPIFNQNQGPIAEAEAHRAERAAEIVDTQARAINEIDRAIATVTAARQEAARAREAMETLRKQSQAVSQRLSAGSADQTEVETAAIEENAATVVLLDAESRALVAEAELKAALQVPNIAVQTPNFIGLASQ